MEEHVDALRIELGRSQNLHGGLGGGVPPLCKNGKVRIAAYGQAGQSQASHKTYDTNERKQTFHNNQPFQPLSVWHK